MQKRIVTLTINPALDRSTYIDRVAANRKLRCDQPDHEPGGGGINVSRAIRRLGGESLALYPCGGRVGETLKDLLDEEGLAHRPIPVEGRTRQNITVFETNSDQQFIFVMPGPELMDGEWRRVLDELSELDFVPDYIVASGSSPPGVPDDFYRRVADLSSDMGSRLIVDTSEEPLRLAAEAGVYLLKPNMRELGYLAGREIESEEHQVAAARALIEEKKARSLSCRWGLAARSSSPKR